jgi:hypothetical protein
MEYICASIVQIPQRVSALWTGATRNTTRPASRHHVHMSRTRGTRDQAHDTQRAYEPHGYFVDWPVHLCVQGWEYGTE